jgi:hypothetical protein
VEGFALFKDDTQQKWKNYEFLDFGLNARETLQADQ